MWECKSCGYKNTDKYDICIMCDTYRKGKDLTKLIKSNIIIKEATNE